MNPKSDNKYPQREWGVQAWQVTCQKWHAEWRHTLYCMSHRQKPVLLDERNGVRRATDVVYLNWTNLTSPHSPYPCHWTLNNADTFRMQTLLALSRLMRLLSGGGYWLFGKLIKPLTCEGWEVISTILHALRPLTQSLQDGVITHICQR